MWPFSSATRIRALRRASSREKNHWYPSSTGSISMKRGGSRRWCMRTSSAARRETAGRSSAPAGRMSTVPFIPARPPVDPPRSVLYSRHNSAMEDQAPIDCAKANTTLEPLSALDRIRWAVDTLGDSVVLLSSMQKTAVVLMHLFHRLDLSNEVLFVDTGYHFFET